MYHVQNEQAFREALLHQNLQHISGRINYADGTAVALNDTNLLGTPRIETRIITDSDTFNLSELYIGTLEVEFIAANVSESQLIGAEISLQVQIELDNGDLSMPVPMGVWDIVSAPITSANTRKITAYDHIARLSAPLGDSGPGSIRFSTVLSMISSKANIEFSQSIEDLAELFPRAQISDMRPISYHFAGTCWLEVQYIAQYLEAYVVATRDGRIEFRKYNIIGDAVKTITANERFDAMVDSSAFYVRGFGYTDKFGHTVELLSSELAGTRTSIIYLPQDNVFIIDAADESYESIYTRILDPIREEFELAVWYPGTIEYYGDPTLDVGDMVYLTGGSAGTGFKKFLICQNTWQFRGPQMLVSGGPPRIGNTIVASGAGGNSIYNSTTINTTKNIILDQLKGYKGAIFEGKRTAARGKFSVTEATAVFVTCTLSLSARGNAEVYIDGAKAGISMSASDTLSFTLPVMVTTGTHSVKVEINGTGEVKEVQGTVWGQEITPLAIDYDETDWEYTTSANNSEITGYTGDSAVIEVPEMLGGKPVTVICDGAFSDGEQAEISVYIPDGVVQIE
ncbi:MAG: hypothetical protein KBA55_12385 [Ruminococcus sp.]|nr:hypothetical protein [Ruminococcus sp.]